MSSVDVHIPHFLVEALLILFVGLKLTGYITWSWWWVLSPLWLPIAVTLAILVILGLTYLIANTIHEVWRG